MTQTLDEYLRSDAEKPSNVQIGRLFGVSEATVRRRKQKLENDEFFDVPREIITSRGKSVRLPDGSWEKISYQPNRAALLDVLNYDDLAPLIANYTPPTPATTLATHNTHTEILNVSDCQIGKASERGGGTRETVERVLSATNSFVARCAESRPEAVVIVDGGDIIENMFNTPSQPYTNDLDVAAQIRTARRLMLEVLQLTAHLAPTCYYVSVPSNHGQVRSAQKDQAGTVDADFGLEIGYQLEDALSLAPADSPLHNIEFVRPPSLDETATLTTSGTKLAFNHGHRAGATNKAREAWWAAQDHGRMPGWDADILVLAHYHHLYLQQSGDSRWLIGVSSPEPGSGYFALSNGQRSKRGLTAFAVQDGEWFDLAVL